ncbi:hypothetical protein B5M47_02060 [candidate division CPR3 bacterium 4484_211]|uniref:YggT family protein n=1 Tax=candidate division CPR3 bacterium 4484_211 TaxID=1968527 RepID=A0A1W9NY71_UNCC3|nr:MAG: hypothetical protein B5M47_02060 [candidate division CPR3 bacterium 4484_211]
MGVLKAHVVKQIILFSLVVVEFMLGLRVFLVLTGANPEALFVKWVTDFTHPLALPFLGMFSSSASGVGARVEFSTIFGMLMYAVLAYLLIRVVEIVEKTRK